MQHHTNLSLNLKLIIKLSSALLALASFSAVAQTMAHQHAAAGAHGDDGIGQPGVAAKVGRIVRIDMDDNMRFSPDQLQVKAGDTIKFVVVNRGKIKHEMVLGSDAQLKSHYAAMLKNPEMEHADDNQITLAPGRSGEIIWQFSQAGVVSFACLQPGHYDAGMKGSVNVADNGKAHQH